ncbi:hypothetical protein [Streptomyces sp. NPDC057686]|uniref:hypothetical protein n=1 Tax=Streptomyces sp. NPDC057686 TaxID=3346212 RepID=UPI003690D363
MAGKTEPVAPVAAGDKGSMRLSRSCSAELRPQVRLCWEGGLLTEIAKALERDE